MPSPEGRGLARRLWDGYAAAANRIRPAAWDRAFHRLGEEWTVDLIGFWVTWHLYGGFEGLLRLGWHRATIYRKLKLFRTVLGKHPDEYQVTGVTLDPVAFWEAYLKPRAEGKG